MSEVSTRGDYRWFLALDTRWMDNDVYGHLNNVVYYSLFDTAVNRFLIERDVLDIHQGETVGLVVETGCAYHRALSYPDRVEAGIRVAHLGRTSVRYEVAVFKHGDAEAAAEGHFVHVYVDRTTRRPTPLPDALRSALASILVPQSGS